MLNIQKLYKKNLPRFFRQNMFANISGQIEVINQTFKKLMCNKYL